MVQIEGKYVNDKNENLDEYFKAVGMPFVPRKMVSNSHPSMEIKKENDEWVISTSTLFRTNVIKFKLGEDYNEEMPGGTLKNNTVMEGDNKFVTKSVGPNDTHISKIYEFSDDGCVITLTHEKSGQVAKRHFKRT